LGVDQGTSGSRALILDRAGQMRGYGYRPLARLHPRRGWVEQDPTEVTAGVASAITTAIAEAGCRPSDIAACGIACQRNTDFVWHAVTGQPLAKAITWQDLRTDSLLADLAQWPQADQWRRRLGYTPGPFSSALHLAWRLHHQQEVAEAAQTGQLRVGFSASWLLAALGQPAGYWLDFSLVQQLGLFDFRHEDYWAGWLAALEISPEILPVTVPTVHPYGTLTVTGPDGLRADVPVWAMIGDQQAALFGYDCRRPGETECTHGTASFVNVCTGSEAPYYADVINTYFAWSLATDALHDVRRAQQSEIAHTFCLEARTAATGSAIRWMMEEARLFDRVEELELLADSVTDSGGVVFVPAFGGLFSPAEDATARGTVLGLTLGSSRSHIVRAFVEGVAYETRAILELVQANSSDIEIAQLKVGGGVSASDAVCQIQADALGIPVVRPTFTETTGRAAALLAGLGVGVWKSPDDLPALPSEHTLFEPRITADERDAGYRRWLEAVERARGWAVER
jgi:glycerol kinase